MAAPDVDTLFGPRPSDTGTAAPPPPPGTPNVDKLFGPAPAPGPSFWDSLVPTTWSNALASGQYVAGRLGKGITEAMPPSLPVMVGRSLGLMSTPDLKLSQDWGGGQAPNELSRVAGGVVQSAAANPAITALDPWLAVRGGIGAEAGREAFPNSPLAPIIGGAALGATRMPISPAAHGTGIGGILIGEAGAEWLHNTVTSLGHNIAPETARFLAPLVGYAIPHMYNAVKQVMSHPLMLRHPALGGVMGTEGQTPSSSGNQLQRSQAYPTMADPQGQSSAVPLPYL